LAVTYGIYAKSIWHKADVGGYWGGGIAEKDGNGAVRGMCNTMLGYALLAHAWKEQWLTIDQRDRLTSEGLGREQLLGYVRENLTHVCAHHTSAPKALQPTWGQSWQSSLWLGAAVVGAHLVWEDLDPQLREALGQVAASEADRLAAIPPGDYRPGDTKAEENAWNTLALASALSLTPRAAAAPAWWRALRSYAVNTYSQKTDHASSATVGTDRVCDIVRTANLFEDFSLENHGFFHPDYVQVSGQHMGEAWTLLALGDRRHATDYARRFEPYALHHVADVWRAVMRPPLLPNGEFVFPNGNDWTFHCSMNQGYLAWIATGVRDPIAVVAERRAIQPALDRREVSPPGRILGDSNLVWWWEPLLIKRCTGALLLHALRGEPKVSTKLEEELSSATWTLMLPAAKVWLHRNANYVVTLAWGARRMATFTPTGPDFLKHPYTTLPIDDGVIPASTAEVNELATTHSVHAVSFALKDGRTGYLLCMEQSVLWLSPQPLRALGIENDRLSGGKRLLRSGSGERVVNALTSEPKILLSGAWMAVDSLLGMAGLAEGFEYAPAGGFNRRSAAVDRVTPLGQWGAWQMLPQASAEQAQAAAREFSAEYTGKSARIKLRDGAQGKRFGVEAVMDARSLKGNTLGGELRLETLE
jgi:hypothetical protein